MVPRLPVSIEDATHTLQRMVERQISWEDVVAVVAHPQKLVEGHSGRMNYYGVVKGRRLRITVDAAGAVWTVTVAGGPS